MAKSKQKHTNTAAQATGANVPVKPQPKPQQAATTKTLDKASTRAMLAGGIALITWLFYKVCLGNKITNWDDPGYILNNALIKDVSGEGIKQIFSTPIMGNYHPLTILSYAIEYSFVRLDPWLYHLDSVLFHLLVTVLVYYFVQMLTKRPIAAAVTALLFGLHPMHVESVAWLAGRKDVVYSTFYIAACIGYLKYVRATNGKAKWYTWTIVLFLLSLLSKPVAVILPVTLLLIDFFEQRKWGKGVLLEKLPFFGISVVFGIRSMIDQKAFGSLSTQNVAYGFFERIALGGYAFVTYVWKAIMPVGLSCFYPYPVLDDAHRLPMGYYIYPLIVVGALAAVWYFRKNRVVVFGSLFFLVNIVLLLQFLPVGGAIIADRYSYIPYMGLFFMLGWLVSSFFEEGGKRQMGNIALVAVGGYSLYLGMLTTERCKAWCDTTSLWRDEIEKQPNAPNAYNNLGFHYFNKFNESVNETERRIFYDSSYNLLKYAIVLDKKFANPYVTLGELYRAAGKFAEAKDYYNQAIALNDKDGNSNSYLGLAIVYAISGNTDSSDICFRKAIENKPYFPEAHSNYGNLYDMLGKPEQALKEYGLAISQNPDMYAPHLNRARLLHRLKRCTEAMQDFNASIDLNPESGEAYYSRAICLNESGKRADALQDVEHAIQLGYKQINPSFYQMLKGR